jgi:hypothetical protein
MTMSEDKRTVLVLTEPVEFGKEAISELHFRAPRAKDFRRFPMDPSIGDMLDLAGKLSGQPDAVIDGMGVGDFQAVMELVGGFFPGGPGTGKTA